MAHDKMLQDGFEFQWKLRDTPDMPLEDLQAERDVLGKLAPRRVGETNSTQYERFDLPQVMKNGSAMSQSKLRRG